MMKVRLGTIEVTDEERRAIGRDEGRLATREEVRLYFIMSAQGELEQLFSDYGDEQAELEEMRREAEEVDDD